ncbi:MAG: alpha/beta fold hydrolase [Bacteroidales bacterium]|nr:alpha/beta fold hydrolase [Bacteroidales bacterium]
MDVSFYSYKSGYDGLDIGAVSVLPEGRPVALIQVAHGMCGSKERFLPFMQYMAERGVACFANDHRGHGDSVRSQDDLGYMYGGGLEALVADMKIMASNIREKHPDIPFYMIGHSMGSMAVRAYLRKYPEGVDGVILCGSPGFNQMAHIGYAFASTACLCGLGRLRPKLLQQMQSDAYNRCFEDEGAQAWICSDPSIRNAFIEDPRHNFRFTLDGSRCLLGLMMQAYSSDGWAIADPELPVLFLSGEDDSCMGGIPGLDKAMSVMRKAGYRNISKKIYPAMRHEILNEIGKERVWRDILDFLVP